MIAEVFTAGIQRMTEMVLKNKPSTYLEIKDGLYTDDLNFMQRLDSIFQTKSDIH
jgi:hypothetical protein